MKINPYFNQENDSGLYPKYTGQLELDWVGQYSWNLHYISVFMNKSKNRVSISYDGILSLFLGIIALKYFVYFLRRSVFRDHFGIFSYQAGDMLLQYFEGIIYRRALLGTFISFFPANWWYTIIAILFHSAYLITIIFVVRKVNSKSVLLVLLSSPFLFLYYIQGGWCFYTKEVLFFPFVILVNTIFQFESKKNLKYVVLLGISMILLLMYEGAIFLLFPYFLFLLIRYKYGVLKIILYISILIVLFFSLKVHNQETSQAFDQFLISHNIHDENIAVFQSMEVDYRIHNTLKKLISGSILNYIPFLFLTGFFLKKMKFVLQEDLLLICLQTVGILGITLIATDYGRWFVFPLCIFFLYKISLGNNFVNVSGYKKKRERFWFLLFIGSNFLYTIPSLTGEFGNLEKGFFPYVDWILRNFIN